MNRYEFARKQDGHQRLIDEGKKVEQTNRLMCSATNQFEPLESRIDALRRALQFWPEGDFRRQGLIDQVPDLYAKLQHREFAKA